MKILVAVTTCNWRRQHAESQQQTWAKDYPVALHLNDNRDVEIDIKFFFGGQAPEGSNNVVLSCRDDYKGLPEKVQGACQWALLKGYDFLCKVDDDVYLRPERLLSITGDYVGLYREPFHKAFAGYCSGFTYCLSHRALEIIANAPSPNLEQEDLWVANTLQKHKINGTHDERFVLTCGKNRLLPTAFNNIIAAAEFSEMTAPHTKWLESLAELEDTTNSLLV